MRSNYVVTGAVVAGLLLASCSPKMAPTPTPNATFQARLTLDSIMRTEQGAEVVRCSSEKDEAIVPTVRISGADYKLTWASVPISDGIGDYSAKISGGSIRLTPFTFDCIDAFWDNEYSQVIAFGHDASLFPSKLAALAPAVGTSEHKFDAASIFHPGHIKSVLTAYGVVDTPRNPQPALQKDFLVVTAASNISELIAEATPAGGKAPPYIPVAFLVDRGSWQSSSGQLTVVSYMVLGTQGQPVLPRLVETQPREFQSIVSSAALQLEYQLDIDGQLTPHSIPFNDFFAQQPLFNAVRFGEYFIK